MIERCFLLLLCVCMFTICLYYTHFKDFFSSSFSSEFDNFLMERAAAAETMPTIPAQTGQQPAAARNTRQMKKDEEENPLFAL